MLNLVLHDPLKIQIMFNPTLDNYVFHLWRINYAAVYLFFYKKFTKDRLLRLISYVAAIAKDQRKKGEMHWSRRFTFLFCQSENVILANLQIRNSADLKQHGFDRPSGLNSEYLRTSYLFDKVRGGAEK